MCILQNKKITYYIHLLFPVEHSCIGTSTKFTAAHGWQFVKEEMMILKNKETMDKDEMDAQVLPNYENVEGSRGNRQAASPSPSMMTQVVNHSLGNKTIKYVKERI